MSDKNDTFADINELHQHLQSCFDAEAKKYRARAWKDRDSRTSVTFTPSRVPRTISAMFARLLELGYAVKVIPPAESSHIGS